MDDAKETCMTRRDQVDGGVDQSMSAKRAQYVARSTSMIRLNRMQSSRVNTQAPLRTCPVPSQFARAGNGSAILSCKNAFVACWPRTPKIAKSSDARMTDCPDGKRNKRNEWSDETPLLIQTGGLRDSTPEYLPRWRCAQEFLARFGTCTCILPPASGRSVLEGNEHPVEVSLLPKPSPSQAACSASRDGWPNCVPESLLGVTGAGRGERFCTANLALSGEPRHTNTLILVKNSGIRRQTVRQQAFKRIHLQCYRCIGCDTIISILFIKYFVPVQSTVLSFETFRGNIVNRVMADTAIQKLDLENNESRLLLGRSFRGCTLCGCPCSGNQSQLHLPCTLVLRDTRRERSRSSTGKRIVNRGGSCSAVASFGRMPQMHGAHLSISASGLFLA
eukprot:scaffold408_cov347-Pavlova_lutheri.AAC.57